MAINRDCLGKAYGPVHTLVDAERIAAYAAATSDPTGAYRDGTCAPPAFGVVPVWPAIQQALADEDLGIDVGRVVHGEQRMTFHRLIRAGDELTSTGTVSSIEDRGANEVFVLSFTTRDAGGALVTTQDVVCVSRGTGGGAKPASRPAGDEPAPAPDAVQVVQLPDDITFRYAQASGDDNRIHVDDEFARQVGLPGIIVQGLCLFSMALRSVIDETSAGAPEAVQAASVRFLRPLLPGTEMHTHVYRTPDGARFEVRGPDGRTALSGDVTAG